MKEHDYDYYNKHNNGWIPISVSCPYNSQYFDVWIPSDNSGKGEILTKCYKNKKGKWANKDGELTSHPLFWHKFRQPKMEFIKQSMNEEKIICKPTNYKEFEVGLYVTSYNLRKRAFVGKISSFDEKNVTLHIIDVSDPKSPIQTLRTTILPVETCKTICNPYKTANNILKNRTA